MRKIILNVIIINIVLLFLKTCPTYRQFKYTFMFTKDNRNQVSVDTNDRHLGQCIGRLTVDSRDLTKLRRRRQWERLKHNRFYEQNNNSARASRFFVNFFAVSEQLRSEMTRF